MPKIYSYRKITDAFTTLLLVEPDNQRDPSPPHVVELCTINGLTYVSVPDGLVLPDQPQEIECRLVTLTDDLRAAITRNSPYLQLINSRVQNRIRDQYDHADELKLIRSKGKTTKATKEFEDYDQYVEGCRSWGQAEKAKVLP